MSSDDSFEKKKAAEYAPTDGLSDDVLSDVTLSENSEEEEARLKAQEEEELSMNFFEEDRHRLDYSYRPLFLILMLDSYVGFYKFDLSYFPPFVNTCAYISLAKKSMLKLTWLIHHSLLVPSWR